MHRCSECNSDSIEQQSSVWTPMNGEDSEPTDWIYEDNYWCPDCDSECIPIEDGKDAK